MLRRGPYRVGVMECQALAWLCSWGDGLLGFGVALEFRLTFCCGPLSWGDGLPWFGVAPSIEVKDSLRSPWPLSVGYGLLRLH